MICVHQDKFGRQCKENNAWIEASDGKALCPLHREVVPSSVPGIPLPIVTPDTSNLRGEELREYIISSLQSLFQDVKTMIDNAADVYERITSIEEEIEKLKETLNV